MRTIGFKNRLVSASLILVAALGVMLVTGTSANAQNYRDRGGNYYRNDNWRGNGLQFRRNEIIRIAQQTGYRDGFSQGRSDRFRRLRYGFDNSSHYRGGLSGFRWHSGDRELYRRVYREAFRRGYIAGFRSGTGHGRWPF
jgi:hypothetical protein